MVELSPGHHPDPDRLHPEFMKLYFAVAKERGLLMERESPGIQTIAVLDFDNNSIDQHERLEPLRGGFADMLISDLSKLTSLKVVERERVRFILDELDLEQTAKFDPETAVRVGKMLGVHSILIGSFTKVGERMRLDTRLIRTETGELIKADQLTRKTDDFFKLIDDAAELVAKDLELKVSDAERGAIQKADNESMDALIYYSEGLDLYDRGEYRKAYEKFREALKVNPDYERAEMRLAALKPLVG
jgi:TolB-like protein